MDNNIYQEMFQYVQSYFEKYGGDVSTNTYQVFRKRVEHTKRVYRWLERLLEKEQISGLREVELKTACIFHDIGYASQHEPHAQESVKIFRKYAKEKQGIQADIDFICQLIAAHSDKERLNDDKLPMELVLLMEADMLDEEGAMSIVMDALIEGQQRNPSYTQLQKRLHVYPIQILDGNPLKTKTGRQFWREKQQLVGEFIRQYTRDLEIREFE